ncbi:MAG: response regulator [Acidobacteriota bacterium]
MNNVFDSSSQKKKILCVEDHEDTCELIAFILSDYEVVFTESIENSLNLFSKVDFDLCILDNWLIDGLGTDLCSQIKSIKPEIPVIFASGVAQKDEIQKALDSGAKAYLVKPYPPDELQKIVNQLIEKG